MALILPLLCAVEVFRKPLQPRLLVGFPKEVFAISHIFDKSTQPTTTGISVIGRLINFFRRLHCIALRHDLNATYRSHVKNVFIFVATLYAHVGLVLTKAV